MMRADIERIRELNAAKKFGHKESAFEHCSKLLERIDELEKVLAWYAEARTWNQYCPDSFGDRARAALADKPEKPGVEFD